MTDPDPCPTIDDMTTALQIAEKAIQLADQNPDFVYEVPKTDNPWRNCLYVHEGKGSCLFGQAIMDLGVADAEYLARNAGWRIGGLVEDMWHNGYVGDKGDADLRAFMTSAQIAQDNGKTWADAVATLREYVGKQTA